MGSVANRPLTSAGTNGYTEKTVDVDAILQNATESMIFMAEAKNVLGTVLQSCSVDPMTGFFRDGCCRSGAEDLGLHLVCAQVTESFLEFSKRRGNDLITPVPEFRFPGLKSGDRWCLCVLRWREALEAGVAPPVILEATHVSTLEFVDLEDLQSHAVS